MKFGLADTIIEKIIVIFEQHSKVDKAIVFGSRAKGNYRTDSDIDIAIKGYDITLDDILKMSVALEDAGITNKIDLIDYNSIKEPALVEHIHRVGIETYSRWKEYKLGDLINVINGFAFKSDDFLDTDNEDALPIIKIKNVANGDVHLNDVQYHYYTESLAKYVIHKGDILISLTGNHPELETQVVGLVSKYKLDNKALLNQRVAKIVSKDDKKLLNNYAYYFLKDKNTHQYLASQSSGSANQANISKGDIEHTPISLPPIKEQAAITSTLSSVDNKIDLLQRQNKTLEQLAETLFRQWFVEEAEASWEVAKICDVAEINSKTILGNYPYSEIEYLDTGSITEGTIDEFQTYKLADKPSRAQRIVSNNDIIYSLVRPIHRHYGLLDKVNPNTVVSTGFCVISSKNFSPHFIYLLLTRDESVEYFDMLAEASTSTYPSLKPSDIANFGFQKPPQEKLERYSSIVSDAWDKIQSNSIQIAALTKLRDTLLPKLMCGEVRMKM